MKTLQEEYDELMSISIDTADTLRSVLGWLERHDELDGIDIDYLSSWLQTTAQKLERVI